jgi:hypothetical protein
VVLPRCIFLFLNCMIRRVPTAAVLRSVRVQRFLLCLLPL